MCSLTFIACMDVCVTSPKECRHFAVSLILSSSFSSIPCTESNSRLFTVELRMSNTLNAFCCYAVFFHIQVFLFPFHSHIHMNHSCFDWFWWLISCSATNAYVKLGAYSILYRFDVSISFRALDTFWVESLNRYKWFGWKAEESLSWHCQLNRLITVGKSMIPGRFW